MINLSEFWNIALPTSGDQDFRHVGKDAALRGLADVKAAAQEKDEDGEDEAGGGNGEAEGPTNAGLDIDDKG